MSEYVEHPDGGYFVTGSRVSLDSVFYTFLRGESPEGIGDSFPVLRLEQIFGALAFYPPNRARVDHYLSEGVREFEALQQQARLERPSLYAKLNAARKVDALPSA